MSRRVKVRKFWELIPLALRNKPFTLYVVSLIWLANAFALVTGTTAGLIFLPANGWLVFIITLYFLVSSTIIILSTFANSSKHSTFSVFGQMYGWLALSAASASAAVLYIVNWFGAYHFAYPLEFIFIIFVWLGLAGASLLRSTDILINHKEI